MIIVCVHFSLLCLTVSTSVTAATAATAATVSAAVHAHASAAAASIYSAADTAVSRAVRAALLPIPILVLVLVLVLVLIFVRAVSAHLQFVGGDIVFQCAASRTLSTRYLLCKSTYVQT